MFVVIWGISYAPPGEEAWAEGIRNSDEALICQQYFPFIVHSPMAALSLVGSQQTSVVEQLMPIPCNSACHADNINMPVRTLLIGSEFIVELAS